MAYPAFDYLTPDAYLELESQQGEKHEYFEGPPYATAGAEGEPKFIVAALVSKVNIFPGDRKSKVLTCDLCVTTPEFDPCTYPDNTLLYEMPRRKENRNDTLTNPTTIAEVMSPSTRGYVDTLAFQLQFRDIYRAVSFFEGDARQFHFER